MKKHDIFISYRRRDTSDKAEHLKDLLDRRYKNRVSFDRENLTGLFDVALARRIDNCKDFLLVVGKNTFHYTEEDFDPEQVALYNFLATCTLEEFDNKIKELGANAPIDFVRIEIARALQHDNLNIIPISLEKTQDFSFTDLKLPPDIAGIKRYGVVFYSDNPDKLFKDIMPNLTSRLVSKPDFPLWKVVFPLIILAMAGTCSFIWYQHMKKSNLQSELEKKYSGFHLYLNKDLSTSQINTIDDILNNMVTVKPDTLWMSQFEFTVGQWNGILEKTCDKSQKDMPATGLSFGEIYLFLSDLSNMTNIGFDLPSAEEWKYAARSGIHSDSTLYAGSNDADDVAWFKDNSAGMLHPSNGQQGKNPNRLDLYDMCGNAGEFCNTPYIAGTDDASYTVCGGDYTSPAEDVTVTSRKGVNPDAKDKTTGFRIIIRKQSN